jgi:hypothetical protein
MNIRPATLFVFVISLLCVKTVFSAVQNINKDASPLDLSISAAFVDDINPTLEQELGAWGAVIASKGQLVASYEGAQFLLDYSANLERYKLTEDTLLLDDRPEFDTFKIKLFSRFFISQSWHVDAQVQHLDQTQRFGEGISQLRNNVSVADRLKLNRGAVSLLYGNDTSSRYISMTAFSSKTSYEPNNDYSSSFDIAVQGLEFDIAFKQSNASSLLFRLAAKDEDFVSDIRQDSRVYQALLGMDWRPSGKTKLEALFGMYSRELDSQDSSSGLSWTLDFSTEPTEDWLVEVQSARFSGISKSELTSTSVEQNVALAVTYKVSEQWHFGINMSSGNTEFEEVDVVSGLDEMRAGVNITLILKEHSKLLFKWGINDQSFADSSNDFQQSEARLTWEVNL